MTEAQGATVGASLEQRMQRPARELVRDRVEERLETEYEQLIITKSSFSKGLTQLRAEHERLSNDLRALIVDRDDKSRAHKIDEQTLRSRQKMLARPHAGQVPAKVVAKRPKSAQKPRTKESPTKERPTTGERRSRTPK